MNWLKSQEEEIKFYWKSQDGLEIGAIGSILDLNYAPKFTNNNDSPALFFGGQAFFKDQPAKDSEWDSFPKVRFCLPKCMVIRENGTVKATINGFNSLPTTNFSFYSLPTHAKEKLNLHSPHYIPSSTTWKELTENALKKIQESVFEKVVLARKASFVKNSMVNPLEILSELPSVNSTLFAVQFSPNALFLGATPEKLFSRKGRDLYTEAIAGTRKRGKTDREDKLLEEELLSSTKDRNEFNFVKDSIKKALTPLCDTISCKETDQIIKTAKVQHLHHPFQATLLDSVFDEDILTALHPTAAIGGLPKENALLHLLFHEPFERGWYSAPIGFCSQNHSSFVVGIRSALFKKDEVHLFSGAGIVTGSDPEKEWEELDEKIALWDEK